MTPTSLKSPPARTTSTSRGPWLLVGGAVAAGLLIAGGIWLSMKEPMPTQPRADEPESGVIVLGAPPKRAGAGEPTPPYWMEGRADVIAVARVGKAISQRGQKLISLQIVDVLKGETNLKEIKTADGYPPFGCIPPRDPKTFSALFQEGARVAVYLSHDPKTGWQTIQMLAMDRDREKGWRDWLRPYLEMYSARHADDPAKRYRELLLPEDRIQLEMAQFWALQHDPDPQAAGTIREIFRRVLTQKLNIQMASPENLVRLLARMHDAESIPLVLSYIDSLPADHYTRDEAIQHLPALCTHADQTTIKAVIARLEQYQQQYKGPQKPPSYRILAETLKALR